MSLSRDWDVTYLSARGAEGAFEATAAWLLRHGFPNAQQLILVATALEKIDWLLEAQGRPGGRPVLLVDDLTRGHHLAKPLPDTEMRMALEAAGLRAEVRS